ncbi:hypothetical protein N334_00253, partial [Pelecanus crispus]
VGQSITLVDRHGVGDTVPGVHNNTSGTTGGVQGQHGLDGHVHGRGVEGLRCHNERRFGTESEGRRRGEQRYLRHLLPVGLGVEGRLRQQHGVLLGGHAQLVVEGVVPDLLHVIP